MSVAKCECGHEFLDAFNFKRHQETCMAAIKAKCNHEGFWMGETESRSAMCWKCGTSKLAYLEQQLEAQRKELEALRAESEWVRKDSAFYRCCALSGEVPKVGSEPSASKPINAPREG